MLFLFPVVSKYLPQQMKNLRNWVHMQHECNTPPSAISNTAFNRGVTPEAGAPGLCFGTLHFAFLTLYSGSIR